MTAKLSLAVLILPALPFLTLGLGELAAEDHLGPRGSFATAGRDFVLQPARISSQDSSAEAIPFAPMPTDTRSPQPAAPLWPSYPWVEEQAAGQHDKSAIRFIEVEHLTNGISPRIDYLLWRARRRGLDFAIVDPNDNGLPEGPVLSTFYDTDSGVRFGFAFTLPGPQWELSAYYTYFHAHGNQTFLAPANGVIYPTVLSPVGPRQVTGAFAQANVDLDVVDLQFGPRLTVGELFLLSLFGGVRLGQVKMRHNAFYTGGDTGGFDEFLSFTGTRSFDEVRFRGLGIRVGGEGAWRCAEYTDVFARGSLAILSGRFSESLLQDDAGQPFVNLAEKWEQLVPVLELALGVSYEFREDMRVAIGYEFSHWFGLVDSVDLSDDVAVGKTMRRRSDLTFEGLFVQLAIFF
ncbi:MAG: Lpg1974 family pore-forming outer membrane protein [Gemmatales bacterium]|nr:Lpg1974 family pore-forming outer membrane protein [Gemmatales bacterium]MDW8385665.1 Lpg1974 family pore-forming outer membrane protein [Gemmatales bacterium]